MKNKITAIALVALVIMQIVSFVQIGNLRNTINNYENNFHNEIDHLRTEISGIYSNVDNMLEEEASILQTAEYEIGELNLDTLVAPVTFTIVPKTIADDTTVAIDINGTPHQTTRNNTEFTATVDIEMGDVVTPNIVITTGGIQHLQAMNARISLTDEFVPEISYPRFTGIENPSPEYSASGHVRFDVKEAMNGNSITTAEFIAKVDDAEVFTLPFEQPHNGSFEAPVTMEFPVSAGQTVSYYVNATDEMGFTHEHLFHRQTIGSENHMHVQNRTVYAPNGEIVVEYKEEF